MMMNGGWEAPFVHRNAKSNWVQRVEIGAGADKEGLLELGGGLGVCREGIRGSRVLWSWCVWKIDWLLSTCRRIGNIAIVLWDARIVHRAAMVREVGKDSPCSRNKSSPPLCFLHNTLTDSTLHSRITSCIHCKSKISMSTSN